MTWPGNVAFCHIKDRGRFVFFFGQFSDIPVHVQSLENRTDNSETSWVISRLTIGLVGDGSLQIIDGSSLADNTVE